MGAPLLNPISKWFSGLSPYGRMSFQPLQLLQGSDLPPRQCRPSSREEEAQQARCLLRLVLAAALKMFLQK